jgi:predicted nucleotidyltransferase
MLNIHLHARPIVEASVALTKAAFKERLLASYVFGSLARGDFSEHYSDVDLAFILQAPITLDDKQQFQALLQSKSLLNFPLGKVLSFFWASKDAIVEDKVDPHMRLNAFDRADLYYHGKLIDGIEVRTDHFIAPKRQQLEKEAIELAIDKLFTPFVLKMIFDPRLIFNQAIIPPSKIILFPVRLFYHAMTGEIGGNREAVKFYCQTNEDEKSKIIQDAASWRVHKPDLNQIDFQLLQEYLPILYLELITLFKTKMTLAHELKILNTLEQWETALHQGMREA